MECANDDCCADVSNEGLDGFCADHKVEAVMRSIKQLDHRMAEMERQTTSIATELRHLMIDLSVLRSG